MFAIRFNDREKSVESFSHEELKKNLGNLGNFTEMTVQCMSLSVGISETIGIFENLTSLVICNNSAFSSFPESIGNLKNLTSLDIRDNSAFMILPESLGNLNNLTYLRFRYNYSLVSLPKTIGNLQNLKKLVIDCNRSLRSLPETIENLQNLKKLIIANNDKLVITETIGKTIGKLKNLKTLEIDNNPYTTPHVVSTIYYTLEETRYYKKTNSKRSIPENNTKGGIISKMSVPMTDDEKNMFVDLLIQVASRVSEMAPETMREMQEFHGKAFVSVGDFLRTLKIEDKLSEDDSVKRRKFLTFMGLVQAYETARQRSHVNVPEMPNNYLNAIYAIETRNWLRRYKDVKKAIDAQMFGGGLNRGLYDHASPAIVKFLSGDGEELEAQSDLLKKFEELKANKDGQKNAAAVLNDLQSAMGMDALIVNSLIRLLPGGKISGNMSAQMKNLLGLFIQLYEKHETFRPQGTPDPIIGATEEVNESFLMKFETEKFEAAIKKIIEDGNKAFENPENPLLHAARTHSLSLQKAVEEAKKLLNSNKIEEE